MEQLIPGGRPGRPPQELDPLPPGPLPLWRLASTILAMSIVMPKIILVAALFSVIGTQLGGIAEDMLGLAVGQGASWGWLLGAAVGLILGPYCRLDFARVIPDADSQPTPETDERTRWTTSRDAAGRREVFRPVVMFTLAGGTLACCFGWPVLVVTWSIVASPWAPPGWHIGPVFEWWLLGTAAGLVIGAMAGTILAIVYPFRKDSSPFEMERTKDSQRSLTTGCSGPASRATEPNR